MMGAQWGQRKISSLESPQMFVMAWIERLDYGVGLLMIVMTHATCRQAGIQVDTVLTLLSYETHCLSAKISKVHHYHYIFEDNSISVLSSSLLLLYPSVSYFLICLSCLLLLLRA